MDITAVPALSAVAVRWNEFLRGFYRLFTTLKSRSSFGGEYTPRQHQLDVQAWIVRATSPDVENKQPSLVSHEELLSSVYVHVWSEHIADILLKNDSDISEFSMQVEERGRRRRGRKEMIRSAL
jgi:hypothetical protein